MTAAADSLNWLIVRFVEQVPAVRQAVVVSSDGLPLAVSDGVERESANVSAVASGSSASHTDLPDDSVPAL